ETFDLPDTRPSPVLPRAKEVMNRSLFAELQRRNVIRAALLYIGVIWALSQGIAQLLPVFDVPNAVVRWLIVAGIVGFPFWVALAWFYEITPEGLKRERDIEAGESIARQTGRKLDVAIIAVLAVAVVLLVADRFVSHGSHDAHADGSGQSAAAIPEIDKDP